MLPPGPLLAGQPLTTSQTPPLATPPRPGRLWPAGPPPTDHSISLNSLWLAVSDDGLNGPDLAPWLWPALC